MSRTVEAVVAFSIRRPWLVVVAALVLAALGLYLTIARFAINTDTTKLISNDLQWRQDELALDAAFPQRSDLILAVVDAATPGQAEEAAAKLAGALAANKLFKQVDRPDSGPFLAKNGLLLLSKEELARTLAPLPEQRDFLALIARDPSLRGLMDALSFGLEAVEGGLASLDELAKPMAAISAVFERVLAGERAELSWQGLMSGSEPTVADRRKLVLLQPVLDYSALQPGAAASQEVRRTAAALGLTAENDVSVRLTGPVALADEEFVTVAENMALNIGGTIAVVAFILFLALRSTRIIVAVLATLFVGLVVTSGVGLLLVGALNLISVAFAVLFIGLGVDFGVQLAVRYRAERHRTQNLPEALRAAARGIGGSLTLAAVSLVAGFFCFLPTDFTGVSELGLIAGIGMIIAYLATLTFLPALLVLMRPRAETAPVETASLAAVDDWIARNRRPVLIATALVTLAGLPFLTRLSFDSNPMNLRSPEVESVATYLDLTRTSDTATNSIAILAPSTDAAAALAKKIAALPEVSRAVSLMTFVPDDQDEKLALIRQTAGEMGPVFKPTKIAPPSDAENIKALQTTAATLREATKDGNGDVAQATGRLAAALDALAAATPERRAAAQEAALVDFRRLVARLETAMTAEPVTRDNLPPALVSDWVTADRRARVEVFPKENSNDNAVIKRFADAVRTVAPNATGAPVTVNEAGDTITRAFIEAGLFALVAISLILIVAMRNPLHVALALGPLVLAGIWSLQAAYLIGLELNFANIIALPLMFGVGVAFHIYYLIAWRAGVADALASSLTRAIFFSALTTGTAFGSLWLSSHPGTSSMGLLLAVSLFFTLVAAFFVVPAFLGPPPVGHQTTDDGRRI